MAESVETAVDQPCDASVLNSYDWMPLGLLRRDDEIVDPDGEMGVVVEAHFLATERETFRITVSGGGSTEAFMESHWLVQERLAPKPRDMTKGMTLFGIKLAMDAGARLWLPTWVRPAGVNWSGEMLWRQVIAVEPVGMKKGFHIRVATKRGLYVTDGFIITGGRP